MSAHRVSEMQFGVQPQSICSPLKIDHASRRSLGYSQAQEWLLRGDMTTVTPRHYSPIGHFERAVVTFINGGHGVSKPRVFKALKNGAQIKFATR